MNIITRIQSGDETALRLLMDEYGNLLLRTACLLLKDRQTAEEAVQDTFIQAYAKIGQLHDPAKLKPWLLRIVLNRCRMRQRTWSWRHIFPGGDALLRADEESASSAGAEERVIAQWNNLRLTEAVQSLKYLYRECVTLYYFHELSVQEISAQLEIPENTIKSRLARGRALLKKELEKEDVYDG
ncbi:sigma-70 family RNA polymerase sigma factor [Paenibacillus donghaensis]|uniref:RNA polymerase n=1 Tax=Paenibacillus donghaensis TaxID=414771 RepID=A0A2Z2K880_9BACL|nr:sigma-70 family RNA polymerase sigma factor [Paenibacillus donghaensis]ASA19435.1 RNA polymerase [Paenibacillus donghaensis]